MVLIISFSNGYYFTYMSFTFPKQEKLKSKKLIEKLFAKGNSVSNFPIKLVYLKTSLPEEVKAQATVAVPKKKFKNAVDRNRVKRLLRESYRLNKSIIFNNIEDNYAFVFLYLDRDFPQFQPLEKSMEVLLQKFVKKITHEKVD